jgi:hypothetical protein
MPIIVPSQPMTVSQVAESVIKLKGRKLSLNNYNLLRPVYDRNTQLLILKTARQVTKSSTMAHRSVLNGAIGRDGYSVLYVTPLKDQADRYSKLYVDPVIQNSPLIALQCDRSAFRSVRLKSFKNGSVMHFGYTHNGVDRLRGISCDEINWDEVQDMQAGVFDVTEQCMSASPYKNQVYAGTPKSMDNIIERLWNKSSMNEPVIRCSRCGHENIGGDEQNLHQMMTIEGLVCGKCKLLLSMEDVYAAYWLSSIPDREDDFLGIHLPQVYLASNLGKKSWKDIWRYYSSYTKAKFANEIFGLSMGLAGRLITMEELKKCQVLEPFSAPPSKRGYINICGGVDWGISAITSFTTLAIVGMRGDGGFDVIATKRYLDNDPIGQVKDIAKQLRYWEADVCGCDVGVGETNNNLLRRAWKQKNVFGFNYAKRKSLLGYDSRYNKYLLSKTLSLNNLFIEMKEGRYRFTKEPGTDAMFDEIMAEFEETRETGAGINKVFMHDPDQPDDLLHSLNFASTASKLLARVLMVSNDPIEEEGIP